LTAARDEVHEGLSRVAKDTPLKTGYVELGAAVTRIAGPQVWIEGGARLAPRWTTFARGYATGADFGAMAGLKFEFDL
jgi:hypothetical protein